MLNSPALLEYPMVREIMIGLIYGMALATVLSKPRAGRTSLWCGLVCLGGYASLAVWQSLLPPLDQITQTAGSFGQAWLSPLTLRRTWVLAGLVCACQAFENLRLRLGSFQGEARQYLIADLLALALAVALFAAGVRHSELSQREPIFWGGLLFIVIVLPASVACFRIGLSLRALFSCSAAAVGASCVAIGLAWAETHWVQPGQITGHDAITRYSATIAAMMLPRLLFQLASSLYRLAFSPSVCHEAFTATIDLQRDAALDASRELPVDDSNRTCKSAAEQTQPTLRIFA